MTNNTHAELIERLRRADRDWYVPGESYPILSAAADAWIKEVRPLLSAALERLTQPASDAVERWQQMNTFAEPTAMSSTCGVLVATADGVGEAYFRNFGDESDGWWWANTSWGDYPEPDRPEPVAWQPLPEPPRTQP